MNRKDTVEKMLAAVPLFAKLSKKELRQVSSLATPMDFPAGRELTKQGAPGREFMVVLTGELEVYINGKLVANRGPGDFFGEIALLSDRPRTATVVATTPVSVEVIGHREFATLIGDRPEIAQQLLAAMAERLAEGATQDH